MVSGHDGRTCVVVTQSLAVSRNGSSEADQLAASVVIPLYNEEAIIDENLEALAYFFDSIVGLQKWGFVLVDNGSTDGTPSRVQAALSRWPLSRAVNLAEPNYGAALRAGLQSATARWVFVLDVEQWDLPFLAWSWMNRDSYDVFMGSKRADPTLNYQAPYRKFLSCCLNGLLQTLFEFSGSDTHGPKLVDRVSLAEIIAICCLDRGQYDTELVLRALRSCKRLVEIPVVYRESRPPRNLMIKKIVWNLLALRRLVRIMKSVPYQGTVRLYRLSREEVLSQVELVAPNLAKSRNV